MKKLTTDQVMEALQEYSSLEGYDDESLFYYLHVRKDGTLVASYSDADESFSVPFKYSPIDDSYDWENENCEEFMECVEELTDMANEFLAEDKDDDLSSFLG